MSEHFNLSSWLCRLPSRQSCVNGGDKGGQCYDRDAWNDDTQNFDGAWVNRPIVRRYYALAEDGMGHHLPYPLLPGWAKRLFDWRVALSRFPLWLEFKIRGPYYADTARFRFSQWLRRKLLPFWRACPYRGIDWFFHCPTIDCDGKSSFSYRNGECHQCGTRFDKDLQPCAETWRYETGPLEWEEDNSDPFADE